MCLWNRAAFLFKKTVAAVCCQRRLSYKSCEWLISGSRCDWSYQINIVSNSVLQLYYVLCSVVPMVTTRKISIENSNVNWLLHVPGLFIEWVGGKSWTHTHFWMYLDESWLCFTENYLFTQPYIRLSFFLNKWNSTA